MHWIKKSINNKLLDVLDVSSLTSEEIQAMGEQYTQAAAIKMG